MTSDASGNIPAVLRKAGNYIMSWTYPTDTSAYYIGIAYKADDKNPVITKLANNKLTTGLINIGGTVVAQYDGNATQGVICKSYHMQ